MVEYPKGRLGFEAGKLLIIASKEANGQEYTQYWLFREEENGQRRPKRHQNLDK